MAQIRSTIRPGPKTLRSFGDVPLPITWGDHFESLERGGYLEAKFDAGAAITADSEGHKYVRAGTVLVQKSADLWRVANIVADGNADGVADAYASLAVKLGVLKTTVDLADGGGLVGIYLVGGFFAARMPSGAANGTMGLEVAMRGALRLRGFRFAEDY